MRSRILTNNLRLSNTQWKYEPPFETWGSGLFGVWVVSEFKYPWPFYMEIYEREK